MMRKLIDEKGNQYGFLKVIEETRDKNNRVAWRCFCKCGQEKIVRGPDLRKGRVVSCGRCGATIDETNKKYGLLTVVERDYNSTSKSAKWKCSCECGNTTIVSGRCLRTGQTKSCGCLKSHGEYLVGKFLVENKIIFQKEYCFNDLFNISTGNNFRFDFAIFIGNKILLLEYDGEQHFKKQNWKSQTLEEIILRDKLKTDYCKKNNIPLLRISYREKNNIKNLIEVFIKENEE